VLTVRDAHVDLGGHPALAGAELEVARGAVVAVLGPSGSGKSTLLRAVAGLQALDRGTIELDGSRLDDVPPHRRGIGLMFQDDALFPHRDVASNVGFGLRMQSAKKEVIAARVKEMLALVGLAGKEHRSIRSLSGGERKRAALARALAPAPRVLLLDEPLGALDRPLHGRLVTELGGLFRTIGQTTVYVTHDVAEAFALGDRVAVMREGRVVQVAAPEELWASPRDGWIARFIGLENVVDRGATVVITRPEGVAFRLDLAGEALVVSSRRDGPLVTLRARYDSGAEIVSAHTGFERPAPGDRVRVEIESSAVTVIPTESHGDEAATDPA
jgi:thiamine transport system ATP-binding protein